MVSEERKYTRTHEWVRSEGGRLVVGITDYAQNALGDITFVELPAVGASVFKGRECAVIESVKAATEIFAPVTGDVAEVNLALEDAPEKVNGDPFGEGWIFKLTNFEPGELEELMDHSEYERHLESEQ